MPLEIIVAWIVIFVLLYIESHFPNGTFLGVVIAWSTLFVFLYMVRYFFYDSWLQIPGYIISFIITNYIAENIYDFFNRLKKSREY